MSGNIIGHDVLRHSMVVLREFGARCFSAEVLDAQTPVLVDFWAP
jgi:hypothetical protein